MTISSDSLVDEMMTWNLWNPPWPNPEDSISVFMCKVISAGHPFGLKFWCVQGPALQAFSTIREKVHRCLLERGIDLYEDSNQSSVPYSIHCLMVGGAPSNARPYVVIACSDEKFSKKAEEVVAKTSWWCEFMQQYPGFGGIRNLPHAPASLAGPGKRETTISTERTDRINLYMHGSPIFFSSRSSESGGTPGQEAVFGNIVYLGDVPFGLTVAHPLRRRGGLPRSQGFTVSLLSERSTQAIGEICCCSAGTPSDYLDWALIPLDATDLKEPLRLLKEQLSLSNRAQPTLTQDRLTRSRAAGARLTPAMGKFLLPPSDMQVTVLLSKRNGGFIEAILNPTESLICLPGTRKCGLLYSVVLPENVHHGDCGKWVFSPEGGWYGHVIAGIDNTRLCYMASAWKIVNDINTRIGILPDILPGSKSSQCIQAMREFELEQKHHYSNPHKCFRALSLYAAAQIGCRGVVDMLLLHNSIFQLEGTGSGDQPPLAVEGIPQIPISDRGGSMSINEQLENYSMILEAALKYGRGKIAGMVLNEALDYRSVKAWYSALLRTASAQGHGRVVERLLEGDIQTDSESKDARYGTALKAAQSIRNQEIQNLLKNKANATGN